MANYQNNMRYGRPMNPNNVRRNMPGNMNDGCRNMPADNNNNCHNMPSCNNRMDDGRRNMPEHRENCQRRSPEADGCQRRSPESDGCLRRSQEANEGRRQEPCNNSCNAGSRRPMEEHRSCGCRYDALEDFALAMAYVPWQRWGNLFEPCKALQCGTIFEDLSKPFYGKGGCNR